MTYPPLYLKFLPGYAEGSPEDWTRRSKMNKVMVFALSLGMRGDLEEEKHAETIKNIGEKQRQKITGKR